MAFSLLSMMILTKWKLVGKNGYSTESIAIFFTAPETNTSAWNAQAMHGSCIYIYIYILFLLYGFETMMHRHPITLQDSSCRFWANAPEKKFCQKCRAMATNVHAARTAARVRGQTLATISCMPSARPPTDKLTVLQWYSAFCQNRSR